MQGRSLVERRPGPEGATDLVELDFGPLHGSDDEDVGAPTNEETIPFADRLVVTSQLPSTRPRTGVIVIAIASVVALGVMLLTDADADESVEASGSATTLPAATATTRAPTTAPAANSSAEPAAATTTTADETTDLEAAADSADDAAETETEDDPVGDSDAAVDDPADDPAEETAVQAAAPPAAVASDGAAPTGRGDGATVLPSPGAVPAATDTDIPSLPAPAAPETESAAPPAPAPGTEAASGTGSGDGSGSGDGEQAPATTAPAPSTTAPTTTAPTTSAPPATSVPPPAPTGTPGAGAAVWNYYGNPWVPSYLANLTLQGGERYSYRFVAKHSGVMRGFQNYMQANTSRTGYAGGDGGTIRYRLVPDDGSGRPNESSVLAEVIWHPNLRNGSALPPGSNNYTDSHPISFADKFWPSKPTLTGGQTYHLLIENVDPDNTSNYISINNPYAINGRSRSPLGPQVSDWGLVADSGGGWSDYTEPYSGTRYEVNLVVLMDDGSHYGNNYMDPRSSHTISGGNGLRQVFTPGRTVSVDQLSVFTSGSGVLRATLRQGNTTVGTWTASVSGERHSVFDIGSMQLSSGTSYALEFSSDSGSFEMLTFRDGSLGNGYPYPAGGSWDGHAQEGSGGGWSDSFYTYADVAGVAFRTR